MSKKRGAASKPQGFVTLARIARERGLAAEVLSPEYAAQSGVEAQEQGGDKKRKVTLRVQGVLHWLWGFDAYAIIEELDAADPEEIEVLIDSPGGSVDEANALYADLRARARAGVAISTEVRGSAFSAATTILLAGDTRTATETISQIMVHAPWTLAFIGGTLVELDAQYKAIRNGMEAAQNWYAETLRTRSGASAEDIEEWLSTDTYFTAAEALAAGIVTAVQPDAAPEAEDDADALAADNDRARAMANSILRRHLVDASL